MSTDPKTALRPTLEAFRRGTKRSRLRLLAVVCSNGHTLLEVFPTADGPVALWSARERWATDPETGEIVEHRPARVVWWASFVQPVDGADEERAWVFCRCTEATAVDLDWVEEQLTTGARRVIPPAS